MASNWKGAADLRPLLVRIDTLTLDPKNARRHPERNIEAIRASLREFGQRKPIVVLGSVVVAGNGTLEAARLEGWPEIAVTRADDLADEQARAYALVDNQSGDLAIWDAEALRETLGSIPAYLKPVTGFNAEELEAVAAMTFGKAAEGEPKPKTDGEFIVIKFTPEQATIIEGIVAKLRQSEAQPDMSPGRAIELVCANYLSGA